MKSFRRVIISSCVHQIYFSWIKLYLFLCFSFSWKILCVIVGNAFFLSWKNRMCSNSFWFSWKIGCVLIEKLCRKIFASCMLFYILAAVYMRKDCPLSSPPKQGPPFAEISPFSCEFHQKLKVWHTRSRLGLAFLI